MLTPPKSPSVEDFRGCMSETPRTVTTPLGPIEYAERGDGDTILAVHGTLGGWDQGLVVAEFLRVNGFKIIAPSRPGYLGTPLATGRTFALQIRFARAAALAHGDLLHGDLPEGPDRQSLPARHRRPPPLRVIAGSGSRIRSSQRRTSPGSTASGAPAPLGCRKGLSRRRAGRRSPAPSTPRYSASSLV